MPGAVAGALLLATPVCAQTAGDASEALQVPSLDVSQEPPPDALPAPTFGPSTRARLGQVHPTATNMPVWPNQIGPAAFVEKFEAGRLGRDWYAHERGPNATWSENDWRPENAQLEEPGLSLVMSKQGPGARAPLSSAEINYKDRFRYGYFESRFRVPRGAGVVTGFFTFAKEDGTRRTWNEIDVEILGRDPRTVEFTVHVEGTSVNKRVDLGFDSAAAFHTYGFEWTPSVVRWYVDNKLVHEVSGPVVAKIVRPQLLHINVWGTNELRAWAGRINPDAGPWAYDVSCIAYRPSYDGRSLCAE